MAVSIANTINTVLQSVLTKSRKKLLMAVAKSHVLYAWASANGKVEWEDGGYEITNPLIVGRNPNIASYRYYDEVPIEQTDEFDTVKYYFSRIAGSLMISEQEIDENRGTAKIFDLLAQKMKILEESIKDKFSQYLYGAGAGTDPNGLALLVPSDPTTGTVGGKSMASNTWWRTSSYDFDGTLNATNIEQAWDDIQMDLTVKSDKPDIILCGRNIYRMYKQAVRDKFVIMKDGTSSDKTMYDLGFDGVKHNNMTMVFDEDCPVSDAYFLNSDHLKLHIMKHVNWRQKELTAPWNMDVIGRRIVWQGQWCRWRAWRTHAYVTNT